MMVRLPTAYYRLLNVRTQRRAVMGNQWGEGGEEFVSDFAYSRRMHQLTSTSGSNFGVISWT